MGFGMGLGSFAQGLAGGLAIGESLQKSAEERDIKNQITAATAEVKQQFGDKFGTDEANVALNSRIATIHNKSGRLDDARKASALSDSFKSRHEEATLKSGLKTAADEASQKYGDGKGGLTDEGYTYMMKKSAAAFTAAGQPDKAREYLKWAEEGETKANTKRFADGLRQIDMGDIDGFDKTLGKIGAAKGYGPQVGVGFARGDDGKIITNEKDGETYYRMKITPPGAKEPVFQDVPKSRMKDVYARWFNPQAAFEAEQSARAGQAKRGAELEDYSTKKGIDARFGDPAKTEKARGDAVDGLRKRDFGGKTFDDLPDSQKEIEIQKELGLRRSPAAGAGTSAPGLSAQSGRSIVMDRATGQPAKLLGQPKAPTSPAQQRAQPSPEQRSAAPGLEPDDAVTAQAREANPEAAARLFGVAPQAATPAEPQPAPRRITAPGLGYAAPEAARSAFGSVKAAPAGDLGRMRATSDVETRSARLEEINRQIGALRTEQGAPNQSVITQLEGERGALLEELNAARRSWR